MLRPLRALAACLLVLGGAAPAAAQQSAGRVLHGRVLEIGTSTPVAGVEIHVAGGLRAITGSEGEWRVEGVGDAGEIVAVHVGYAEARARFDAHSPSAPIVLWLTPKPISLERLVVTASRRGQELKAVAVPTEVIDRAQLRQAGASDLAAVLGEQTGIAVQAGHPAGAGIMLQGLGSERVLVLVDGQPFIGRLSGSQDLSRIPTAIVDRVEIVKGPQSTLYGSEAMGGVVNVITRDPRADVVEGGIEVVGGTHGRLDVATDLRGSLDDVTLSLDLGRRFIDLTPGLDSEAGTSSSRWDGLVKLGWRTTPSLSLEASGMFLDERQRWRSGQFYTFADNTQWSGRLGAQWRTERLSVSPTLYASEFRHTFRRSTSSTGSGGGEQEVQQLVEAELLYSLDAGQFVIDGGVEASREAIRSERVIGHARVLSAVEPFAQATWSRGAFSLVPGVRLSWSERWGTHWSPRIAVLVRPVDRIALRAAIGSGYRAPDFKELYMEFLNVGPGFGYVVRGNPDIRPEVSRNISGSVEWAGDRVYARVQAFHNRFRDFIETHEVGDSAGVAVYTYGNIDHGTTRGADLELGWTWRALRAEAGWSVLRARNDAGEVLLGRPDHAGRVALSWAAPFGLRASTTAVFTGPTPVRREGDAVVERGSFARFDLRLTQDAPRGFEVSLGVDNIADTRPPDWPGFLGRQLYLGISWRAARGAAGS